MKTNESLSAMGNDFILLYHRNIEKSSKYAMVFFYVSKPNQHAKGEYQTVIPIYAWQPITRYSTSDNSWCTTMSASYGMKSLELVPFECSLAPDP